MTDSSNDEGIRSNRTPNRSPDPRSGVPPRIEVAFTLELNDCMAFYDLNQAEQKQAKRSSSGWAPLVFFLLIASIALAVPLLKRESASWNEIVMGAGAGLFIATYLFGRPLFRQMVRRSLRHDPNLFLPHRVVLTPDAVESSAGPSTTRTLWEGVVKVVAKKEHLFIFTGKRAAIVVPYRAFASDESLDEFIDAARHYFRASGASHRDRREKE